MSLITSTRLRMSEKEVCKRMSKIDYTSLLDYIDPACLSYNEWLSVGMALHYEGLSADVWDAWSKQDTARYHSGECIRKWSGFGHNADAPVTGGTLVELAKKNGYEVLNGHELGWNDTITVDDAPSVIDHHYIENGELSEPENWQPAQQIIDYIKTLFKPDEYVGYVTKAYPQQDGTLKPSAGSFDRTAQQLIEKLGRCGGDIGAVFGDPDPEAGAWIRFNPLDGQGVRNDNVTAYRFALVESDSMDVERQYAVMRGLELPIACLVHSGNKSIHAIVRIDAPDYPEYRKRVDYLYSICQKNGLEIDTQNRNPSRLSRMPGVIRSGKKQYLIGTNIGKASWNDWAEWIEAQKDELPETLNLADAWDDMPDLAPCLIDGILRQGHKMLIAGASKAGKSFLLLELAIAIAEGRSWLGYNCAQGRVWYVNLELDKASCLHRLKDVYTALGIPPDNIRNIDILNLRGMALPLDKLVPILIRRARTRGYIAVIIDPIYKVITGDENSASEMAHFCNQFDRICSDLGCSVIYCHHHSKGSQGSKRAVDRASGSGVFARDPDALLDLIELDVPDDLRTNMTNSRLAVKCREWLYRFTPEYKSESDNTADYNSLFRLCRERLPENALSALFGELNDVRKTSQALSAWRIEATLREFPKPPTVDCWFDWPIHHIDNGSLKDASTDEDDCQHKQNNSKKKTNKERRDDRCDKLDRAFDVIAENGYTTVEEMCNYLDISIRSLRRYIEESGNYKVSSWTPKGKITRTDDE